MSLLHHRGIRHCRALPLALVGLLVLSTPTWVFERAGTVICFSLEDLQLDLRPLLQRDQGPSPMPHLDWFTLRTDQQQYKNGPIERSMRWGNGQGIDGYRLPEMRPLWG